MPKTKTYSKYPLDWSGGFGLTDQVKGFYLNVDQDGQVEAILAVPATSNPGSARTNNWSPVVISDGGTVASYARCFGNPLFPGVTDITVGLITNSREMNYFPSDGSAFTATWLGNRGTFKSDTTSAVNTAQTVTLDAGAITTARHNVDIISICSAGTATLVIEVSTDNVTWLQIDSLPAAATVVQHYDATVVGAGTYPVCPLGFPRIRVTAGTAGAGNTTRLRIVGC